MRSVTLLVPPAAGLEGWPAEAMLGVCSGGEAELAQSFGWRGVRRTRMPVKHEVGRGARDDSR